MPNDVHDQALISAWSDKLSQAETANDAFAWLKDLHWRHCEWREKSCINLLASEAPMSAEAKALLASPLASRTAAGHIGQRLFAGGKYIDDIEALCHASLQKLFNCRYVEHRVLGGTQACQIIYASQLTRGDTLISVAEENGGDSSNSSPSILSTMGVNVIALPFEDDGLSISFDRLESLLVSNKVKMLSLGLSVSLIATDHSRLIQLCRHYGVLCHIDCAHELGLIAGGVYPNPLSFGADFVTASTGKTFSGPQGGVLLWNDQQYSKALLKYTFPYSIGGYQNNRILALTLSTLELLYFGNDYMKNVLSNANHLTHYLKQLGLTPWLGEENCGQTHQIVLMTQGPTPLAIKRLESCHIITSMALLPRSSAMTQTHAIRLGVMEVSRLGMQAKEMLILAQCISRALVGKEPINNIIFDVVALRENFQQIYYCHHHPRPS